MRLLLGAFGDPGHAFPMIALGRALAARGNDVTLQTWRRWEEHVVAGGMAFAPAPEDPVFPTPGHPMNPYDAALPLTRMTLPLVEDVRPDAVVADILTLAPALAAELAGVRVATLIPHVHPALERGMPPYSIGARRPRTAVGRALWRAPGSLMDRGLEVGRGELNATRVELGLPPVRPAVGRPEQGAVPRGHVPPARVPAQLAAGHRGRRPAAVGAAVSRTTPSRRPVTGRSCWSPRRRPRIPATAFCAAPSWGWPTCPSACLRTTNRRPLPEPLAVPANARVVDWLSYARTMPRCDVVVCHGGHGTVARALASGCVVVVVPAAGDMAENAARVDWARVGIRVPRRMCTPRAIGLAVGRALAKPGLRHRAREMSAWAAGHDAPGHAAGLVERFARD